MAPAKEVVKLIKKIIVLTYYISWTEIIYFQITALTWNFRIGPTRNTWKQQKLTGFSEEFLRKNNFEAVIATFCCYDYGVNAFEAIEKIVTDQKDYHKLLFIISFILIRKRIFLSHIYRNRLFRPIDYRLFKCSLFSIVGCIARAYQG